ncbi:MAG: hypothetical protein M3Y64_02495 [Gemmatimonadota bacterium]|nr:hypothetical protein [Gemmatimonadota bacterium]
MTTLEDALMAKGLMHAEPQCEQPLRPQPHQPALLQMRLRTARACRVGAFALVAGLSLSYGTSTVWAQRPSTAPADTAREKLRSLNWMVGDWSGPATVITGGQTFAITQHEHVFTAANATVLLIQGYGTMPDGAGGERRVFESAGLLSFDMGSRQYKWVSSGGTGFVGISDAIVKGDTLVWQLSDAGPQRSRYTISRNGRGEWQEIGETTKDGISWTRTFEMALVKK